MEKFFLSKTNNVRIVLMSLGLFILIDITYYNYFFNDHKNGFCHSSGVMNSFNIDYRLCLNFRLHVYRFKRTKYESLIIMCYLLNNENTV